MPRNLILAASLPAEPDRLFDMYLDPKAHAAFTGAPVMIEARPGTEFRAFEGALTGTLLHIEPKRLIVQTSTGLVSFERVMTLIREIREPLDEPECVPPALEDRQPDARFGSAALRCPNPHTVQGRQCQQRNSCRRPPVSESSETPTQG